MKSSQEREPGHKKTTVLAGQRTELAIRRTVLAADRTLLAWVRTSLSLMTFGFTIYKFFQYLVESGAAAEDWQPTGPRRFGLFLVALATVLLAAQTWQYYKLLKRLSESNDKPVPKTASLMAGIAISLLGVAIFLSMILGPPFF